MTSPYSEHMTEKRLFTHHLWYLRENQIESLTNKNISWLYHESILEAAIHDFCILYLVKAPSGIGVTSNFIPSKIGMMFRKLSGTLGRATNEISFQNFTLR